MAQLTVYNPDGSIVDVFSISDALAVELTKILQYSERKSLDLALLKEFESRILSTISKGFSISTVYYFSPFLDVISRVENLPNANSLTIFVND